MGYYETLNATWECECGWKGLGKDATRMMATLDTIAIRCPTCARRFAVAALPTFEESRRNWSSLSDFEKRQVEIGEARFRRYESLKLKAPEQLPDLDDEEMVFSFGMSQDPESEIVIKLGPRVVWREPGFYECYERFIELGRLLKLKYGQRMRDLVPTEESMLNLYGDRLGAVRAVEEFRAILSA